MIDVIILLIAIAILTYGIIKLIIFLRELKTLLEKLKKISDSENLEKYNNLLVEVDELNFSYYEILDRFDMRLDSYEEELKEINKKLISSQKDSKIKQEVKKTKEKEIADKDEILKKQVLALREKNLEIIEIASSLDVDVSTVEMICKIKK